ncbi:MAG: hypothetical protein ABIO24_14515 [Saprospiraceae bacterium]
MNRLFLYLAISLPLYCVGQRVNLPDKLPPNRFDDLKEFKAAQIEIQSNWAAIMESCVNYALNHSTGDPEEVKSFTSYRVYLGDTLFKENKSSFIALLALKNDGGIEYLNLFRSGIIEFVIKTEYRFEKNKTLLHVLRFGENKEDGYPGKMINLDSKLRENELGILQFEKLEEGWTYEIWAYGSY